ncbi:hypothetical protein DAI22_11g092900 [Oryza sativa Japonica Group]|nr:hypothetical protein DAI22_11g092900 [Oryza sativa Japonica Group]
MNGAGNDEAGITVLLAQEPPPNSGSVAAASPHKCPPTPGLCHGLLRQAKHRCIRKCSGRITWMECYASAGTIMTSRARAAQSRASRRFASTSWVVLDQSSYFSYEFIFIYLCHTLKILNI